MSKVMFSLPNNLVTRMRVVIPDGERSRMVADFLEKEVEKREQHFYEGALQLEAHEGLRAEMKEWNDVFGQDGLDHV